MSNRLRVEVAQRNYDEAAKKHSLFKDQLQKALDSYTNTWYHQNRVDYAKQNPGWTHPRIENVKALQSLIDKHQFTIPLAKAIHKYTNDSSNFSWAWLSPLISAMNGAVESFEENHSLRVIDSHLELYRTESLSSEPTNSFTFEEASYTDSDDTFSSDALSSNSESPENKKKARAKLTQGERVAQESAILRFPTEPRKAKQAEDSIKKELEKKNLECLKLTNQLESVTAELKQVKLELINATDHSKTSEETNTPLQEANKKLNLLDSQKRQLEKEKANAEEQVQALRAELSQINETLAGVQNDSGTLSKALEEAQNKTRALEEEKLKLENEHKRLLEKEKALTADQVQKLKTELNQTKEKLATAQKDAESLHKALAEEKSRSASPAPEPAIKEELNQDKSEQANEALRKALETTQKKNEELKKEILRLNKDNAHKAQTINRQNIIIEKLETALKDLQSAVSSFLKMSNVAISSFSEMFAQAAKLFRKAVVENAAPKKIATAISNVLGKKKDNKSEAAAPGDANSADKKPPEKKSPFGVFKKGGGPLGRKHSETDKKPPAKKLAFGVLARGEGSLGQKHSETAPPPVPARTQKDALKQEPTIDTTKLDGKALRDKMREEIVRKEGALYSLAVETIDPKTSKTAAKISEEYFSSQSAVTKALDNANTILRENQSSLVYDETIDQILERKEAMLNQLSQLNAENKRLHQQISEAQRNNLTTEHITALEDEITRLKSQNEKLDAEKATAEETSSENASLKTEISRLMAQIETLRQLNEQKGEVSAEAVDTALLQAEIDSLKAENVLLASQINSQADQIAPEEKQKLLDTIDELQEQLAAAKEAQAAMTDPSTPAVIEENAPADLGPPPPPPGAPPPPPPTVMSNKPNFKINKGSANNQDPPPQDASNSTSDGAKETKPLSFHDELSNLDKLRSGLRKASDRKLPEKKAEAISDNVSFLAAALAKKFDSLNNLSKKEKAYKQQSQTHPPGTPVDIDEDWDTSHHNN